MKLYGFQLPSFLSGMRSVFDLGGVSLRFRISADPWKADRDALASDWRAVGQDMREAAKLYHEDPERE